MTPKEQAAAARLLAKWIAISERISKPTTDDAGFAADTADLEILRIETQAFVDHQPAPPAAAPARRTLWRR